MSQVSKLLAVFVAFSFILHGFALFDYCSIERKKCQNRPHIGCNKRSTFKVNKNCHDIQIVRMDQQMKDTVVRAHNKAREKLAQGKVYNYPQASRMLEMFWDDELAATACEHAKYCQFDHDQCRATPSYDHPGQNLRKSSDYLESESNYNIILDETVDDWFEEYANINPSIVDKYFSRGGKMYGHFTVMSREVNDRVGCCLMQYLHYERRYWWRNSFVTCNYRETNYIGEPVYYRGPTTSQCHTWGNNYQRSPRYPGLCTDNYYGDRKVSNSYDPYVAASSQVYESRIQLVTAPSLVNVSTPSYCQLEKPKCRGKRHLGCEKNENYFTINQACASNGAFVPIDVGMKRVILDTHNSLRDSIAAGAVNTYPTASKMLEMEWDNELADVACEHVKYCQPAADGCRSTVHYDQPGQNTKLFSTTSPHESATEVLQKGIRGWFEENNASRQKSWGKSAKASTSVHFNNMARDSNNKVGCCYIKYNEKVHGQTTYRHMFTCNYREEQKPNADLYVIGKPKSLCNSRTSNRWKHLCTSPAI